MSNKAPKLILFPGLGTDGRLFERQRPAFPDLWVPPWIPPRNKESLADYAARMAEVIAGDCPDFCAAKMGPSPSSLSRDFILGGVSLGGMLAYEIARHVKPRAEVLIASCRTRMGVNGFLRTAGNIFWPIVPTGALKVAKFVSLPALRMFGSLMPEHRRLCAKMFSESDPWFTRWAVSAILNWNPEPLEQTPIFQIHGSHDLLIPAKYVEPDELLPHGGHLINLTHADAVNAFIQGVVAKA
ncbi:MAG: alpha/beta hydrolase [Thermoguttaceae bacterium]|jgi:pimeloyl-ACP methyl ester carboxylesterase